MKRVLVLVIPVFVASGCNHREPRFAVIASADAPYVMFDNETAQACYAGSVEALKDREAAIRRQANADATLDKPSSLGGYYFEGRNPNLPTQALVEFSRQSLEYSKKAAEEYREADRLAEFEALPTCRSLLGKDRQGKN